LYNLGIIFGAIVLYPYFGLLGIGYGVICGALMHAALHIPVLVHAEVFPRFVLPSWRILRGVIADSIPRSFALAMGSFTTLALTVLVAPIAAGSVSVFTFASNLVAVPLSLIGASYAVAAFPALSEHRVSENRDEFSRVLITSARHIVLWSLVSLGLIVVLRAHIVRSVLGAGAFDWQDTRLTAALLAVFTAGLVAQGLVLLFSRALYAAQQSWRPLIYQSIGGVATVLLAVYLLALPLEGLLADLSVLLRISDVGGASVLLVALAATLGQWLLALWSLGALWREAPLLARSLFRPLVHGMLAAVVGGAATYGVLYIEGGMLPLTTLLVVFTDGFIAGIVGLAASALLLAFLKNEEFLDVVRALLRSSGLRSALPPSAGESASS
jgi:putative peptidoglycan lipid II flippase